MIIILIILGMLTIGGIWLDRVSCKYDAIGFVAAMLCGVLLAAALIMLPLNYYNTIADIQEYKAFKETVEEARKTNISEIERAAILQDIAKWNQYTANAKYWNKSIFDIYIPDEVENLEMLK